MHVLIFCLKDNSKQCPILGKLCPLPPTNGQTDNSTLKRRRNQFIFQFLFSPSWSVLRRKVSLDVSLCNWLGQKPHPKNELLTQNTTHLVQRPCYPRGSPCQDPAANRTTRRSPDDRKETQTAVVWSCLPFIRSGQNHLAKHNERGKKTRQAEVEVGGKHQGMDRPGIRQVPEGSGEQGKMEETGCEVIFGAPTTLAVKG